MTTIAVDAVRMEMAADRCATGRFRFEMTKIHRLNDGSVVGVAGRLGFWDIFASWYHAGANLNAWPDALDEISFAQLTHDGEIFHYVDGGRCLVEDKCYATGSGAALALAAMEFGAKPVEAIEYASRRDTGTGMGVDVMSPEAPPDPAALRARIAELEAELAQATSARVATT